MRLLFLFLTFSIFTVACSAQRSDLPKDPPEDVSFDYSITGGMNRSYRRFRIENGLLTYDELKSHQEPKITWTANIGSAEIAALYRAFRDNAFDRIQNDERDGIVHDAGSESISLSLGVGKTYRATYGHNSPLSGSNLRSYRAVREALEKLVEKHRKPGNAGDLKDPAKSLEGAWRAAGDHGNGHTWYLQWKFADGEFEMQGYPPILQKGKYRIARSGDDRLSIVLFDQSGNFGAEERTIEITFGADGQLKIDQMAGFRKVSD